MVDKSQPAYTLSQFCRLLTVQHSASIDVCCPNFTSICPVTLQRNATTLYPLQNIYFYRRHFAPFGPRHPNFNTWYL